MAHFLLHGTLDATITVFKADHLINPNRTTGSAPHIFRKFMEGFEDTLGLQRRWMRAPSFTGGWAETCRCADEETLHYVGCYRRAPDSECVAPVADLGHSSPILSHQ
ncbi:hypothetical protein ACP4OV_016715 [Aristida adscensionis]